MATRIQFRFVVLWDLQKADGTWICGFIWVLHRSKFSWVWAILEVFKIQFMAIRCGIIFRDRNLDDLLRGILVILRISRIDLDWTCRFLAYSLKKDLMLFLLNVRAYLAHPLRCSSSIWDKLHDLLLNLATVLWLLDLKLAQILLSLTEIFFKIIFDALLNLRERRIKLSSWPLLIILIGLRTLLLLAFDLLIWTGISLLWHFQLTRSRHI